MKYELTTWSAAIASVDPAERLFLDVESVGLYGKLRLVQLMQADWDAVKMVEWPDPFEVITGLAGIRWAAHNAHYDATNIAEQAGISWAPDTMDDTLLLARLALPQLDKYGLDDLLTLVLKRDPYRGMNKAALQKSNWGARTLTPEQLAYAATDVFYMPALWSVVQHKLEDRSYVLDKLTLLHCLRFQANGMKIDKTRLKTRWEQNLAELEELAVPINVNSYIQVRKYIGSEDSDDLALARHAAAGNERAANVRRARKLMKQNNFLSRYDTESGYVRGKFKPTARSGRLTSNDDNMQQIPRALKTIFGYEDKSRVLIFADYAQLELRTICAITGCTAMAELFRNGEDLHGYTAEMVFGKNWTPEHRQITKTYNFNLLYGGGIPMILTILLKNTGINQDPAEATRARAKWRNLWKEVYAWQQRGIRHFQAGRLGRTPMGREYKAKLMTDQLNIENQGAGAEVAKLALHYLLKEPLPEDCKLVNFIHDSYIIDAPNDPAVYGPLAQRLAECMQLAWFEMSKLYKIDDLPMPVDVRVGHNWGDIEKGIDVIHRLELPPMQMLETARA